MSRSVYRALLWLHPPLFRRRFAAEMLWLFDETVASEGVAALLLDGLVSLLRQWLTGRMTWRFAAAVLGALLQVGMVAALTANHAARVAPARSVSPGAVTAARRAPTMVSGTASASLTPEPATVNAATPAGDAPLVFMLFFGIVLVYAFQRRRFQHRTLNRARAAGANTHLSIIAK
jgi:hypothetical protein